MLKLLRTDHKDDNFISLTRELDEELKQLYGNYQKKFDAQNKLDKTVKVILAYDADTAVGCGALRPMSGSEMVEIKRMFVQPSFRGRGISKIILAELEALAKEIGYKNIKLETGKNQPAAIGLYLKTGYSITAPYGEYKFIDEAICMEKILITK